MPDADSEARACPFCKEEVKAAAIRCKHCLADIPLVKPDHGGVCPLCKEEINADAIRCMHCKAALVPGAQVVLARARRPMRIVRRRPMAGPVESGRPRGRLGRSDPLAPVAASADRSGDGCPEFISTPYGTYHLVDSGVGDDGWHYCGYEPGYGVFEDDDLIPYEPTVLRS